ncbi:adenine deaminase [Poritiphilus flavus]|uniref:Adenine deaminase n=1 Tax=Poritiphilus flavus TaxID=2697053 RepID=A0A6L9ECM5_9FLAO|nr:adenine deaminase [Poritiphilus flavus]NAS12447.1 adenine deaminase [Poritiphilus flavus]
MTRINGQLVDIPGRRIYPAEILFSNGRISAVREIKQAADHFILPGFVDAHVHIESSMLVPSEFARLAVLQGTVATVSDPHEIANVLGADGVRFMIENGRKVPLKFHFGAPSCVPATSFETSGATIDANGIDQLLSLPDIYYLAEMMNYPGVLTDDEEVYQKIAHAHAHKKPVDGHAPGLMGPELQKYIEAGISTDHECFSYAEGLEKLERGMKVIIREGSAAKNFEALIDLLPEHYGNMMFCSDDKHPDDLVKGHINQLCARAVAKGMDVFKVLQAACLNPIAHYNMDVGQLREGDAADFILIDDLVDFKVLQTFINGECVAKNNRSLIGTVPFSTPNNFECDPRRPEDFFVSADSSNIRVIEALDGELITNEIQASIPVHKGGLSSDIQKDILKVAVVNRYKNTEPAVGFIKNFGLKKGAIASSVAHDSHNIIAVGTTDEALCEAVNLIIQNKGGISCVSDAGHQCLALPVAGIMSDKGGLEVAKAYEELDSMAKSLGSQLRAPFMTLSFMALLVIPDLKLSDKGLFSGRSFSFVDLFAD